MDRREPLHVISLVATVSIHAKHAQVSSENIFSSLDPIGQESRSLTKGNWQFFCVVELVKELHQAFKKTVMLIDSRQFCEGEEAIGELVVHVTHTTYRHQSAGALFLADASNTFIFFIRYSAFFIYLLTLFNVHYKTLAAYTLISL